MQTHLIFLLLLGILTPQVSSHPKFDPTEVITDAVSSYTQSLGEKRAYRAQMDALHVNVTFEEPEVVYTMKFPIQETVCQSSADQRQQQCPVLEKGKSTLCTVRMAQLLAGVRTASTVHIICDPLNPTDKPQRLRIRRSKGSKGGRGGGKGGGRGGGRPGGGSSIAGGGSRGGSPPAGSPAVTAGFLHSVGIAGATNPFGEKVGVGLHMERVSWKLHHVCLGQLWRGPGDPGFGGTPRSSRTEATETSRITRDKRAPYTPEVTDVTQAGTAYIRSFFNHSGGPQ